ncbi:hypothetical protein LDO26_06460 [Luteimonas sp. BDR2-5]|uniref:hypothetical protein n=1 Tax=Proluteimonas luteida TaxID=2878685 RepID=UPI001E657643|nr:hypothetical protein [Luteimonas sp. BDR2-5]MCD9027845.1 hypothetical protein [Luteimonas sp. BDR2-5]
MTSPTPRILAIALLGTLAVAGCKQDAPAPVAPPAAAEPAPEPAPAPPAPAVVTGVELGNEIDADNRVTTPASEFGTGDTIYASVTTDGESAAKLNARWVYGEDRLVRSTDADVAAGPQVLAFDIHHPEGWPTGDYKVEISLDGTVVEIREFAIR